MANAGGINAIQHPLSAKASGIAAAGGDPRPKKMSHFMTANEGPAEIAAKISGLNLGGKQDENSAYFKNNEGHPWPDRAHSKIVGGLPLVSDTLLLQKQQTFNRSENLEREVSRHCCHDNESDNRLTSFG
ncbi:hypothetical protein N7G274_002465 [Stereocaulon virgatum]|uniref:Uncharacterized protein n=1 Tax=Stereocaulon virgatum TaxID=373712 RepID=A0ABR4AIL4_9LECA